jgi:hypothetical protein
MARALPLATLTYLGEKKQVCRSLLSSVNFTDVSFTYAAGVVPELGSKLTSLRHLIAGSGHPDLDQVTVIAGCAAATHLPQLRALTVVSSGLGRLASTEAKDRACNALRAWSVAHPSLQSVTVYYMVDAHSAGPMEDVRSEELTAHKTLCFEIARLPLTFCTTPDLVTERIRYVTREIDPQRPALAERLQACARQLLSLLHTWRFSSCKRLLHMALELLVLFARLDHGGNLKVDEQPYAFSRLLSLCTRRFLTHINLAPLHNTLV